jgi:hypothetical protein
MIPREKGGATARMPVARARGERGQPFVVHASRRLHPETHGIEVAHPCINGCKLPGGMARPSYNKRQGEACTYGCAVTWRQRRQAAEWRVVLEEEERTKQLAEAVAAGQRHNIIQDEAEEEEDDSGKRPAAPRDKKSSAVGAALAAGNTRKRQKKAPAAEASWWRRGNRAAKAEAELVAAALDTWISWWRRRRSAPRLPRRE